MNIISKTGFSPIIAAPMAMPVMLPSEIGVSHRRSGPYFSHRPFETPKAPP